MRIDRRLRRIGSVVCGVAGLALSSPRVAQAQELALAFHEGLITLDARNVSVRHLLDEWARLGNVVVVNAELAGDARVSLHLAEVPEREAIGIVLRSAGGYVAVDRGPHTGGPSVFSQILVLDESHLPAVAASSTPASSPSPSATGVIPGPPIFLGDEEPADGRPRDARPGFTAPVRVARTGTSTVEEPLDGRLKGVRREPSTQSGLPRPGSGQEEPNGRPPAKP